MFRIQVRKVMNVLGMFSNPCPRGRALEQLDWKGMLTDKGMIASAVRHAGITGASAGFKIVQKIIAEN